VVVRRGRELTPPASGGTVTSGGRGTLGEICPVPACNPRTRGVVSVSARMDSGARGAAIDVVKHGFPDNPHNPRTAPREPR
jgi:hypothetical protein